VFCVGTRKLSRCCSAGCIRKYRTTVTQQ